MNNPSPVRSKPQSYYGAASLTAFDESTPNSLSHIATKMTWNQISTSKLDCVSPQNPSSLCVSAQKESNHNLRDSKSRKDFNQRIYRKKDLLSSDNSSNSSGEKKLKRQIPKESEKRPIKKELTDFEEVLNTFVGYANRASRYWKQMFGRDCLFSQAERGPDCENENLLNKKRDEPGVIRSKAYKERKLSLTRDQKSRD